MKIYGNGATPICLHIVYGCFYATITELRTQDRYHMACKASDVCYLDLFRKSLPTLV